MHTGLSATAIAAGWKHTCAIVADDGVKCWGYNGDGQLGIGSTADRTSPAAVPGARGEGGGWGVGGMLVSLATLSPALVA